MVGTEPLRERVARLEQEVADNRVLRRRVEELAEQLAQILVAVEDKDHARSRSSSRRCADRSEVPRCEIDERGLVLTDAPNVPLLVHFDEQYVWSFTPGRDGASEGNAVVVGWPAVMRPHLSGTTRIRIATYDGDVVLHDARSPSGPVRDGSASRTSTGRRTTSTRWATSPWPSRTHPTTSSGRSSRPA